MISGGWGRNSYSYFQSLWFISVEVYQIKSVIGMRSIGPTTQRFYQSMGKNLQTPLS